MYRGPQRPNESNSVYLTSQPVISMGSSPLGTICGGRLTVPAVGYISDFLRSFRFPPPFQKMSNSIRAKESVQSVVTSEISKFHP